MAPMVDCHPDKGCTALQLMGKDVEEVNRAVDRHEGSIAEIYKILRDQSTQRQVTTYSALVAAIGVIATLLLTIAKAFGGG